MGKVFERVVTVYLENTLRSSALANPYLNALRKKGVFMSNAQGVTHPSQLNYLASIAGDTMGIGDDDAHYVDWYYVGDDYSPPWQPGTPASYKYNVEGFSPVTIVDLLEAHNLSWKCYAESLPPDDQYKDLIQYDMTKSPAENVANIPPDVFPFARKHVPFLSFPSIVSNKDRLAKIVNADEFATDLQMSNGTDKLPHYSFYVPNLINDGHYISEDEKTRAPGMNIDLGPNNANLKNMQNFLEDFLGPDPVSKFPGSSAYFSGSHCSGPGQCSYPVHGSKH